MATEGKIQSCLQDPQFGLWINDFKCISPQKLPLLESVGAFV